MLASSLEYLKALREGNYLLFLEWMDFINEKYTDNTHSPDADDMVNAFIFEWLTHDYAEADAQNMALLHAVYNREPAPWQGKLAYAFNSLSIALFLCMVFHQHQVTLQPGSRQLTYTRVSHLAHGV